MKKYAILEMLECIKLSSDDIHTKTSAIIATTDGDIVSVGSNTLTRGHTPCDNESQRPLKYKYLEHAERNAIYSAAKRGVSLLGCIMYMRWFPCVDCARAIIQSGVSKIVCDKPDFEDERRGNDFRISHQLFLSAGICIEYIYNN